MHTQHVPNVPYAYTGFPFQLMVCVCQVNFVVVVPARLEDGFVRRCRRFVRVGGLVSRPTRNSFIISCRQAPRYAFIIRQQAVAFSIQATFCIFISWVGSASSQCAPCTRNRIVCAFPIEEQNIVRRARLSRRSKTACRTIFLNIKLWCLYIIYKFPSISC